MPVPRIDRYLDNREQHTECCHESFGALPVLLVHLHAAFEVGNSAAIPVARQPIHLSLQDTQIAQNSVLVVPLLM